MDIMNMVTLGLLFDDDDDSDETTEGGLKMTDVQFKVFINMIVTLAENAKDPKEFRKNYPAILHSESGYGIFSSMILSIADATGDMTQVVQALRDAQKILS